MARDEFDTSHLVCFLTGIGIGAVVTLLFAPQAGRETRRMIARGAERGRDYLSDRAESLREQGRDIYERGREAAEEAAERSRKFVRG